MHVKGKRMAFLGLLLSCTILLIVLGSILEMSTLFFLAAASFCVGIAIRECQFKMGAAFYIAAVLLGLILAPNKLYCITFAAMGFYILAMEFIWERVTRTGKKTGILLWVMKYLIFNLMFIPILIFFPKLLYTGKVSGVIWIFVLLAGQVGIFIFDRAYFYFQVSVWGKFRKHIE